MTARTTTKSTAKSNGTKPGFRRSKAVLLRFDDPEFEGLEVRVRRPSLGELLDISEQADNVVGDVSDMDAEQIAQAKSLLGEFARFLLSWNLEEEVIDAAGQPTDVYDPVPATLDGLMSQDLGFVLSVFQMWMATMGSVPAPLDRPSPAGSPSAAPPILPPVEPLPSPES